MTETLTNAEKAFLAFNWASSEKWLLYYSNLYPTPSGAKLAKYKRAWYRREVDPSLPADSTVGDPPPQPTYTQRYPTTPRSSKFSSFKNTFSTLVACKNALARVEIFSRLAFLVSSVLFIIATYFRFLSVGNYMAANRASTLSFFLFIIMALIREHGLKMSMEWLQAVFMNDNMHYLCYGVALLTLPKTLVLIIPQIFTCLLGLEKLYRVQRSEFPGILRTAYGKELIQMVDVHSSNIYRLRALIEAVALFDVIVGIFTRRAGIINFILYSNFIKLKIAVNDIYLLAVFRQIDALVVSNLSSFGLPPVLLSVYLSLSRYAVDYFKPRRR
ncbi:hypothetical protein BgAZ_207490 [Babesia gibsoni]|uniref:Uncharacterized protein n=1 Tax=Babesia gibsoni TaxID=33632 RepID=A0AAD8PEH4_BABGI|nr:hypothetical protein BgAZ_207490 [Babesia gibsoni]